MGVSSLKRVCLFKLDGAELKKVYLHDHAPIEIGERDSALGREKNRRAINKNRATSDISWPFLFCFLPKYVERMPGWNARSATGIEPGRIKRIRL
jgi:hypothetical protein